MDMAERIQVVSGDITLMHVDAIVNAANTSLLGGGGVDGAIHRAAGPMLLEECRTIGGCPTGEARITGGHGLAAKYVIHTVGPVYSGMASDPEFLRNCYLNCLILAKDRGVRTMAFPAISCGVYGYPMKDASMIAIGTVVDFLKNNDSIAKVFFVLYSERDADIYRDYLQCFL